MGGVVNAVKSVGSTVGNAFMNYTPQGLAIKGIGSALGLSGQPDPESQVAQVDPRLQALQEKQMKQATDYRNNIGDYRQQQKNTASDESRQQLAASIAGVNKSTNARGALYGGYREGQETNARIKNAAELNKTVAGINTNTENTANNLENQALQSGLEVQKALQNRQNQIYNVTQQQNQAKAGAVNGLVSAATKAAGMMG